MRLLPILTALLVAVGIFIFVFQRDLISTDQDAPDETQTTTETVETAEESNLVSVLVKRSTAQPIDASVILRGQTEAQRQVSLRAETSGTVISTPLRKGAFVTEGQAMCELAPGTRDAALADAQARLAEARAKMPQTQARIAAAKAAVLEAEINNTAAFKLSEGGFASETRVASAQAALQSAQAGLSEAEAGLETVAAGIQSAEAGVATASKEIERLVIKAAFDGLLETDTAELGSLLQPGAVCATVIQLDPIKLVGFVPEADVDRVQLGAIAGARLISDSIVQGSVSFISRSADTTTRTFRIEIEIPNPDLKIRDGQSADIFIRAEGARAHLVAGSALTLNNKGDLGLRVVDADNIVRFAPVQVARDSVDGMWLVGLPEQADIIVVGQEYVVDGVEVDVTYQEDAS